MHTSSTHTFLWHDYETFGLHTRRDRPAQFAGIRTDADLNEIGAPMELYCQPQADYLPDPTSCWITGITPQRCQERGIPEFEFARQIEAALGTPGTIGVGYNTIRFDDEVTRNLFWRNLIAPYDREWRNQCGRWDILDLVRATYALRPDGINWPTTVNDQGETRVSMRLELLTAANGIEHAAAHDAVSDVRATIALARLIKHKQPKLFDFYLALHKKDRVLQEMRLPATQMNAKPFIHVSGMFPVERGCMAVMFPLSTHPTNKNEILAWDLSAADCDATVLTNLTAAQIRERLFTKQADLPAGVMRLPIKSVHVNKSPFVVGSRTGEFKILTSALQEKWGIDVAQCLAKADAARALPDMTAVWRDVFARPQTVGGERLDVDEALYDGFVGDADRRTLDICLCRTPAQLAERELAFHDSRLTEVLWRYRARNFPLTLDSEEQAQWQAHCQARLVDGTSGARSLKAYFAEIDKLSADAGVPASRDKQALLAELTAYGTMRAASCAASLAAAP